MREKWRFVKYSFLKVCLLDRVLYFEVYFSENDGRSQEKVGLNGF